MNQLESRISNGKAIIGIIGLGYVGLPLAVEFAGKGYHVLGFEVDKAKVKGICAGKSHVDDIPSAKIAELVESGKLSATVDFGQLGEADAIIICVPTPLRKSKDPDVSYIVSATEKVTATLRKGQLVILESTTYPGTTLDLVKPMLEKSGLKTGTDFHLAFSPERVDPGNSKFGIHNTPKVVGGATPLCGRLASKLYSAVVDRVVTVSSTEAAEMVKLVENTFRAVNIGMVNEIALMCDRLGLSVWEVLDAAATKPFGFMPFYPGPGIGGHCIPLDPHYLAWKMKTLNFEPRFIELAGVINSSMPDHVVHRTGELLNRHKKPLNGSKLLVIGVTYKPDISDARESPSVDVISLLGKTGAKVSYHDPYVPEISIEGRKYRSVPIAPAALRKYDCVLIITPHSCIDYKELAQNSKLVFDARNATRHFKAPNVEKL